jgi:hypothetical protein
MLVLPYGKLNVFVINFMMISSYDFLLYKSLFRTQKRILECHNYGDFLWCRKKVPQQLVTFMNKKCYFWFDFYSGIL